MTDTSGTLDCIFHSNDGKFEKSLTFLVIPQITGPIPNATFPREKIKLPANLTLADPEFHISKTPDILIGSGTTLSLFTRGRFDVSLPGVDIILQETRLGWVVAASVNSSVRGGGDVCNVVELRKLIEKFWIIHDQDAPKSDQVAKGECENHYTKNVYRDESGRYVVRLPFRIAEPDLGDSRKVALNRFFGLKRKLSENWALRESYQVVLDDYFRLGHVSEVLDESAPGYYLPHRAVIKESSTTTKTRVVFDASARSDRGISLNDTLLIGPTIQAKLFSHLLRFRTFRYVITADITQMYRQIWVHPEDRRFLRIFWEKDGKLRVYQLNTVTFGLKPASFLAIRTLHQLAQDERERFPVGAEALMEDFYVDDFISGSDTLDGLIELRDQTKGILQLGGFQLRKWASNNEYVLRDLKEKTDKVEFLISEEIIHKTLGLFWSANCDVFLFSFNSDLSQEKITMRNILSGIARIFDPLGFLEPIILNCKWIMQQCWARKLTWDDSVPSDLSEAWFSFAAQLSLLSDLKIPRYVSSSNQVDKQLHGFSDASQRGYGACLYLRIENRDGSVQVRLLCSKGRVSPLKTQTIPRLELCGALVLARLYDEVKGVLEVPLEKVYLWTDSTIVMQWLKKEPGILQIFESNRVARIQELTGGAEWRHVRSEENPADSISRGQSPRDFLRNQLWFNGPTFLSEPNERWPVSNVSYNENVPGIRDRFCLITQVTNEGWFQRIIVSCSSFEKLVRKVAIMHKFFRYIKFKVEEKRGEQCVFARFKDSQVKIISVTDLGSAEECLIGLAQRIYYRDELRRLRNNEWPRSPKIGALNPFIDASGLLRVGGRLSEANNDEVPYDQKHPILLPTKNILTDLLIRDYHERFFHAGNLSTLYHIRQRYWLIDAKGQIRKILRACVRCRRFKAEPMKYKMGDLPRVRVSPSPPFQRTGIDFFGPIYIKEKKERNRGRVKAYGCIFVCMATKAVHIEAVGDMTTDSFVAALKRFIGRRGNASEIYSDNGSNFVGCNNKLRELYVLMQSEDFQGRVSTELLRHRIQWHFTPPLSPHFGGLWEAAVKSCKYHLKRIMGEALLTFEQLSTLLVDIEAILNSRPLCSISSSPNDPLALTPGHFLIGRNITALPTRDLRLVPENRLTYWERLDKIKQNFWTRWSTDYLSELQTRQKWSYDFDNIKVNSMVILIDKNLPVTRWSLGRVVELHPGEDGVVRVVTVKTATGSYKRNLRTLCLLYSE